MLAQIVGLSFSNFIKQIINKFLLVDNLCIWIHTGTSSGMTLKGLRGRNMKPPGEHQLLLRAPIQGFQW